MHNAICTKLLWLCAFAWVEALSAQDFVVPDGKDTNPGTALLTNGGFTFKLVD